jgi:hypothetical protein
MLAKNEPRLNLTGSEASLDVIDSPEVVQHQQHSSDTGRGDLTDVGRGDELQRADADTGKQLGNELTNVSFKFNQHCCVLPDHPTPRTHPDLPVAGQRLAEHAAGEDQPECEHGRLAAELSSEAEVGEQKVFATVNPVNEQMSTDKGNVVMPMICPTDWMVPMAVRTLAAGMGAPVESVVVANWAMKPELAMRFPFIPTAKASAGGIEANLHTRAHFGNHLSTPQKSLQSKRGKPS